MNKKIRTHIVKCIPFRLRKTLFKLKLYTQAPKLFFLSNVSFKTSCPTVLLSLPRSGSSWIGSIIGMGEDIRYLREPATTNYTLTESTSKSKRKIKRISVFDQDSCDNWAEYQQYINDSLAAKPNFPNSVIAYPKQWQSPKQQKPLLIKEVNPLVINYYLSKQVNMIYLLRHPFSVAKSYQALNWRASDLFEKKFNEESLALIRKLTPNIQKENNWTQMGYLQGWIEALAKSQIINSKNSVVTVRYEDICQAPKSEFKTLFGFIAINYSTKAFSAITKSLSRKSEVGAGDFSLTRNSSELAQVKVKPEEQQVYFQLMNAYQQAFSDFKQNEIALGKQATPNIAASYEANSALVKLL
ncbi:MAG: sulfotransferase domain-containing protein [Colwellia sp.]|nr:sulfotransferase domain-containing protein [Colwellia sp.]